MAIIKPPAGSLIDRSHPLARGLVACVLGNEGAGRCSDPIGGAALTETGSPTWTAGDDGPARKLNGTSQYLTIPYRSALHNPARITIAARLRSDTASDKQYVLNRTYDGSTVPYSLAITPNATDGGAGAGIGFYNAGWSNSGVGGTAIGGDGLYHDVAGTYDGATLRYYLDAVPKASASASGNLPATNANPIDLGTYRNNSYYSALTLEYLFVWDHAKSAADIARIAADPFAAFRYSPARRYFIPAGGGAVTGAADLASIATLAGAAAVQGRGSASLASVGTLAGSASVAEQAAASLASASTLAGSVAVQEQASASLASVATLAGAATVAVQAPGAFASVVTLAGPATVQEHAAGAIACVATLAGDAQAGNALSAASDPASVATLAGSATVQERAGAVLAAVATLAGGATVQEQASASAASVATLAGAAALGGALSASASLSPVATLAGAATLSEQASAAFAAVVTLAAAAQLGSPVTYLEEAIVARIAASAALVALIGPRAFPGAIPETQPLPALAYLTLSDDHSHALSGAAGIARAAVRIDARARTLAEVAAIRHALRTAFDGWKGTVGSVHVLWCRLDGRSTGYEPDDAGSDRGTRAAPSTFVFTYRVSVPTF